MIYNVLAVADYGSAYEGSFMRSLFALEAEIVSGGGRFVYVLPQRAEEREWAKALAGRSKVFFFSGGIIDKALLLRRLIKQNDINIIHSHFATASTYIPIFLAAMGKNVRHAAHLHGEMPSTGGLRGRLKQFFRCADVNICAGQALCDSAGKAGFKNCVCAVNSVDFSRLDNYEVLSKSDFGIDSSGIALLSFGYDFNIKGVDTILEALSDFDKTGKYTLLLCPASHLDEARENILAKFGSVPPFVRLLEPREDIGAYYNAADVFVAASRREGFSYASVEAAYCKLPLVLSDIPAHRQRKLPGAVFFSPGNGRELFDCLEKMQSLTDGDFSAGRKFVQQEYSIGRWVSDIVRIYSDLYKTK